MAAVRVTRWAGDRPPDERALRQRLEAAGLQPRRWANGPGDRYATHEHPYHKVLYCVRGSITFELTATGERLTLTAGDRLDLPPGTAHAAVVGPGGVVCVEAARE